MNRNLIKASLAAAAFAGLTGCKSTPNNPQHADNNGNASPLVTPHPAATQPSATTEATAGSADALLSKTQRWAVEMEPLLARRTKKTSDTQPSIADFLEPDQLSLGPTESSSTKKAEPQATVIPLANPVLDNSQSLSNQGASIVPAVDTKPAPAAAPPKLFADSSIDHNAKEPFAEGDLDLTLNKRLKENPKDVWAHLDYQLLQFLKDKPVPQMNALSRLAAEDRELVTAVMDGLTNFRNGIRADSNTLISRKVRPLLELADRLRAQADLIIPTVSLCTRVDGFGAYEPVEPARFTAMKEHPIIVYCEVENFASHMNEKKLWETKLSQEVVLYTETGLPIWQDKTENIPDFARNRRHDFFVVKKTKFPPNIAVGRYLLKVTIVDQQASRVAEATIPVQFIAQ